MNWFSLRGSVVSLSYICPHPAEDKIKEERRKKKNGANIARMLCFETIVVVHLVFLFDASENNLGYFSPQI